MLELVAPSFSPSTYRL